MVRYTVIAPIITFSQPKPINCSTRVNHLFAAAERGEWTKTARDHVSRKAEYFKAPQTHQKQQNSE